jgi:hypothetical protein
MYKIILLYVLALIPLFKSCNKIEDTNNHLTQNCISVDSLHRLSNIYLEDNNEFTASDYISMTKIYNTLSINDSLLKLKYFMDFYGHYKNIYLFKCIEILEMHIGKGMCYYSKKYNIYIGGPLKPNNSQYNLCSYGIR